MSAGSNDRRQANGRHFKRLQKSLSLPLPTGLPPFVYSDGLDRLRSLQEHPTDEKVYEFRAWVSQVRRCFASDAPAQTKPLESKESIK